MNWSEKTILITGGTGSFGRQLTSLLMADYQPKKIIIFSRDEMKQFTMRAEGFDAANIRYFIGDVRDKERLYRAFYDVDIVVHAAAMKQVPCAEYNPFEAIKTNVIGAANVIDAAIDCGVQQVIALSTDKAAFPFKILGALEMAAPSPRMIRKSPKPYAACATTVKTAPPANTIFMAQPLSWTTRMPQFSMQN